MGSNNARQGLFLILKVEMGLEERTALANDTTGFEI